MNLVGVYNYLKSETPNLSLIITKLQSQLVNNLYVSTMLIG